MTSVASCGEKRRGIPFGSMHVDESPAAWRMPRCATNDLWVSFVPQIYLDRSSQSHIARRYAVGRVRYLGVALLCVSFAGFGPSSFFE